MKILKGILYFVGGLYLIACIGLFFAQDRIFFFPSKLNDNHQFRAGTEVNITVDQNVDLNCLWLKEPNSKGVILYLHGNKGSNRRCLRQANVMAGNQYDIFMPDYRGFGKSDGRMISQKQAFDDIQKVYNFLLTKYKEEEIVITGYSLGTSMATYLAANNDPRHLFLVAPFISFVNLKNRMLPIIPSFIIKFPFRNDKYLEDVKCKVTFFHGTRDELIPFDSSQRLVEINPNNFELITLQGEGHRGAIFDGQFRQGFSQVLRSFQ